MSTFSGGYGPEEEDGAGWGGLVPSKAEREEERRDAELARLRSEVKTLGLVNKTLSLHLTRKEAELAERNADAARYGWLRERDLDTVRDGGVFAGRTPDNVVLNGDDLDAAIDAAMLATPVLVLHNVAGNRLARQGQSELTGVLGGPIRSEKE